MQKRLYEMEVTPPPAVWEKLSLNIDEINQDNRVAQKVLNTELVPPAGIWEKIDSTINVAVEKPFQKKGTVINLRRLAIAAIFIGIIATAWIILRNNNQQSAGLAVENPVETKTVIDSNISHPKTNELKQSELPATDPNLSLASAVPIIKFKKKSTLTRNNDLIAYQPAKASFASLNTQGVEKNFDLPIDDLSNVTSDQNYLTMVNANGRLVKIPTQLASLAPHLQDKPVEEDFYEVMFGEGTYWKETLNEWRKKIASTPTSGDAFTSFVELLKSVQNR
jgi:hypothetical protein